MLGVTINTTFKNVGQKEVSYSPPVLATHFNVIISYTRCKNSGWKKDQWASIVAIF